MCKPPSEKASHPQILIPIFSSHILHPVSSKSIHPSLEVATAAIVIIGTILCSHKHVSNSSQPRGEKKTKRGPSRTEPVLVSILLIIVDRIRYQRPAQQTSAHTQRRTARHHTHPTPARLLIATLLLLVVTPLLRRVVPTAWRPVPGLSAISRLSAIPRLSTISRLSIATTTAIGRGGATIRRVSAAAVSTGIPAMLAVLTMLPVASTHSTQNPAEPTAATAAMARLLPAAQYFPQQAPGLFFPRGQLAREGALATTSVVVVLSPRGVRAVAVAATGAGVFFGLELAREALVFAFAAVVVAKRWLGAMRRAWGAADV